MPQPITPENLISRYASCIAFVAEESPATTLNGFIDQLRTATETLDHADIHGADDLEIAAVYLNDSQQSQKPTEQQVLLNKAADRLRLVEDMVDEYRDMV